MAVGFVATIARLNFVMHDIYHEMAVARAWVETGAFPHADPFAFTPTVDPSVHHEWAMGVLLYGWCLSLGLGIFGLTLLRWLLIVGIVAAVFATARRRGATLLTFASAAPLVFLFAWVGFGTLRATLVTLLFLAIQLRLLEEDRRGRRGWVLLLIPLWVLWVNLHAGFLVGGGLFGLYVLERLFSDAAGFLRRRRCGGQPMAWIRRLGARHWHLFGLCAAAVATLGLTPYGGAYPLYVLEAVRLPRPEIAEWGPLWTTWLAVPTLACYAAALLLAFSAARRLGLRDSAGVLIIAAAGYFALRHLRHGPLLAVVWLCYAPPMFHRAGWSFALQRRVLEHRWLIRRTAIVAIILSFFYIASFDGYATVVHVREGAPTSRQPAGAVDYIERSGWRGRLLTPFHAGAYVLWHQADQVKISLDGRYEVAYPPQLLDEHRSFYRGHSLHADLPHRYGADAILANVELPVVRRLLTDKRWMRVYVDDAYCLFVRSELVGDLRVEDRRGEDLPRRFL